MKGGAAKWVIWLPLGLWGIYSVLAALHPGYRAERLLWSGEVAARRIFQDPVSVPPAVVEGTLARLEKVIQRYPRLQPAARAQLLIGDIHRFRRDFPSARREYEKLRESLSSNDRHVITAYRMTALTFEEEQALGKAVGTYRKLLEAYPRDPRTLDLPLRIAELLGRQDSSSRQAHLQEAVSHYEGILKGGASPELTFLAHQFLLESFLRMEHWAQAVGQLETLVLSYPARPEVPFWIHRAGEIAQKRLQEPERARALALAYAQKYPHLKRRVASWLTPPGAALTPP